MGIHVLIDGLDVEADVDTRATFVVDLLAHGVLVAEELVSQGAGEGDVESCSHFLTHQFAVRAADVEQLEEVPIRTKHIGPGLAFADVEVPLGKLDGGKGFDLGHLFGLLQEAAGRTEGFQIGGVGHAHAVGMGDGGVERVLVALPQGRQRQADEACRQAEDGDDGLQTVLLQVAKRKG